MTLLLQLQTQQLFAHKKTGLRCGGRGESEIISALEKCYNNTETAKRFYKSIPPPSKNVRNRQK